VWEAAQAVEAPVGRALTLGQSREPEFFNEERAQARPEAEDRAEEAPAALGRVVPAAWAQAALADRATQEAVFLHGPQKTRTFWEY
jgi:hypothetical protein